MLLRTPEHWAVAVRRTDGSVHTEAHDVERRSSFAGRSIVRGPALLVESVRIGARALAIALRETTGAEPRPEQITATLVSAFAGLVVIFVVAPGVVASTSGGSFADLLEGAGRAAMLLVYLVTVGRSPQARRLFPYHGAEHKVVAAFESSRREPTPDEARAASPIHVRCGTNFLAIFVMTAGLALSFVPRRPVMVGAAWRIASVPVVTVLAYEVMRAAARSPGSAASRMVTWPGRALQRITTREPSDEELDVALAALRALLGPRNGS